MFGYEALWELVLIVVLGLRFKGSRLRNAEMEGYEPKDNKCKRVNQFQVPLIIMPLCSLEDRGATGH